MLNAVQNEQTGQGAETGAPVSEPGKRSRGKRESLRELVLRLLKEHGLRQVDLAEQTGLSASVVSQWLNGQYDHAGDVVPALKAWAHRITAGGEQFVELRNSSLIFEACQFAIARRRIALIVGKPGLGKTRALEEWHRRMAVANQQVVYLCASPDITSGSQAKALCRRLELPESGTTFDLVERLVHRLRRRPLPIFVDEANCLSVKCLEQLRYIHDQTSVPMVLCGSIKLERTLSETGTQRIELEQLQSRIGLRVSLAPLEERDVVKYLSRHWTGLHPDVVRAFAEKSRGVVRDLFNAVENTRELMEINELTEPTVEVVEAAFKRQVIGD